jgi:hypothetical protein
MTSDYNDLTVQAGCIAGLADVLTQIIISRNTNVALASKNEMKIKVLRGKSDQPKLSNGCVLSKERIYLHSR